jgi:hypothetical protein
MTISGHLLIHSVTLSGDIVTTVPAGKTESVPTFPDKETGVDAHIQALSGRDLFLIFGQERRTTHKIFMYPGVNVRVGHMIKAEDGPYIGEHYRVDLVNRFVNHTEVLAEYSAQDTSDDTLG